jgi:hypothetical protein|tara:strand:- start:229 stop:402 length:174 start_codon:yes stop_codon:yes gene_type:complete
MTTDAGLLQADSGPFSDYGAFEFSEGAEHVYHHASGRHGCVDGFRLGLGTCSSLIDL